MTVDAINFSELKPFAGKTTRSFELLVYQLVVNEYGHLGKFTPIAGEGGDGGIEFFLQLDSGEVWGWQCKYYDDNGRLSQSSRKASIENSLTTACANYPKLIKWTLCLKTDLTIGLNNKNGEINWFSDTLINKIPNAMSVDLDFFGESEIVRMLAKPQNLGVRQFFFSELEISQEWFAKQSAFTLNKTKEKYDPVLHTISDYQQSVIDSALINPGYRALVKQMFADLPKPLPLIKQDLLAFERKTTNDEEEKNRKNTALDYFKRFDTLSQLQMEWFDQVMESLSHYDLDTYNQLITVGRNDSTISDYLGEFSYDEYDKHTSLGERAREIYQAIKSYFRNFDRVIRNYLHQSANYLIYLGDAAAGKTHLACDIIYRRLESSLPALFFTGDSFNNESNLAEALLKLLNIPANYSIENLLAVLDNYGRTHGVKIPIVIDGLNETVHGKYFSPIWRNHLSSLQELVAQTKNVVLVVTCRNSYAEDIWNDNDRRYFHYAERPDYDSIREAIDKYFNKYGLEADLTFANLNRFERLIFLRIFCEIKNPDWQNGTKVQVNINSDSNDQLFGLYFQQINDKLVKTSQLLRRNQPFVADSMNAIAAYLWENNLREIPIDVFYALIDGNIPYERGSSKADLLIDEGLVLTRNIRNTGEFVSITYELIAGYIIAKHLATRHTAEYFAVNGGFHQKVKDHDSRHPLYENIVEEVALLLPQHQNLWLHELYAGEADPYIYAESICSLWFLSGNYIREADIQFIKSYFKSSAIHRRRIIRYFRITQTETGHPLNSALLSDLLLDLSVKDRDLSWTEHLRHDYYDLMPFLNDTIEECINSTVTEVSAARIHMLMPYVQWFLTSTYRPLRDTATKLLYHYGCKYPERFSGMVYASLKVNDPYVWERMLAALYGVVLAHQTKTDSDFQTRVLPMIATRLYELIFDINAPHYTSHALARDYASKCIGVALHYNPALSDAIITHRVHEPYPQSGLLNFPVMKGADKIYNGPMRMDFSNYTIGTIVKDGHSYSNPPEKTKVRGQIFQRIYDLGWSVEGFEDIDRSIQNDHLDRQRPEVERYGKKYSWIAFLELYGYRHDLGLSVNEFHDYRPSETDIDPSFPEKSKADEFPIPDVLGDRSIPLLDWLKVSDSPPIDTCLEMKESNYDWVCLDGYINQSDDLSDRSRFTFIRGLIIKQEDMERFMPLFTNQRLGGRWIPEIIENHYTFAGELYLDPLATYPNTTEIAFELSREKKRVKKGEEGYFPITSTKQTEKGFTITIKEPASRIVDYVHSAKFEVLVPVMEYAWSHNEFVNNIGHHTVVSKEIADQLGLVPGAQTFELLTSTNEKATLYKESFDAGDRRYRLAYLREDLLNEYLSATNTCLVWGIWGEKEPKFSFERREVFYAANKIKGFLNFRKF
jgi:hypothetical protein